MEIRMNSLLLETINNLPPLPATVSELRDYINTAGDNLELSKVATIISKDPLLIAELLKLANSPYYGISRQISTIPQAVSLLGVSNVKNTILADAVKKKFVVDVSPYGLDTDTFLRYSAEETEFISNWLNKEDKALSDTLIPCAMLLRLGMILLSSILIKSNKDKEFLAENMKNNFQNIHELEDKYCGIDSLSFLGFLFDYWKFDEILIQSVTYINNPHSASSETKKSAYALSIINCLFEPYNPLSSFNCKKAIALIKEAKTQNITFDIENFMEKLPNTAKANLQKEDEEV
ncbi:HDOD domain-containing protein [Helicobacter sp. WB40]|uniref:HDOD domain-containing protein n=2 Tax=Helicobacteraceae TaxID=72293 RepID=A0ABT4VFI4_9HELI|nr:MULTISPECIES: HDOD domain-containing protein [Helicobacter]MDA3967759.1 HDOD domain-containing protein [Helicobacter sp. WB40]MDA3969478.1 HDOD domain-containing protein [Helicobacter ibis]